MRLVFSHNAKTSNHFPAWRKTSSMVPFQRWICSVVPQKNKKKHRYPSFLFQSVDGRYSQSKKSVKTVKVVVRSRELGTWIHQRNSHLSRRSDSEQQGAFILAYSEFFFLRCLITEEHGVTVFGFQMKNMWVRSSAGPDPGSVNPQIRVLDQLLPDTRHFSHIEIVHHHRTVNYHLSMFERVKTGHQVDAKGQKTSFTGSFCLSK